MSLERVPDFGTKPIELKIRMPALKPAQRLQLVINLQDLYRKTECTDVELLCADKVFKAHRVVLASCSEVFREGFKQEGGQQVRLAEIANPEAVQFMLDFMYEIELPEECPAVEICKDVLRLGRNFQLPGIAEHATHWLARDITTGNVVQRLSVCQEFGLTNLQDKIVGQLSTNRKALYEVSHSPQIADHPKLMVMLLQHAAQMPEEEDSANKNQIKKRKKSSP